MGGCLGKKSYGPWRHNTPPTDNKEKPKKKSKEKLHITVSEQKSSDNKNSQDGPKDN